MNGSRWSAGVVCIGALASASACIGERGDAVDVAPTRSTAVAATISTAASCSGPIPGLHEVTLDGGGAQHAVRIVVPSSFSGVRLPVVVGFHGLGATGADQARLSGYEQLAEQAGFVAVHPTGVTDGDDSRTAWQLTAPAKRTDADVHDDLAFAVALIDAVVATWCVDPARVYVTGMSNGGFFAARLVCELSDRIAAAVTVAGLFHPDTCAPSRAVPFLAFHGTADEVIPFDGDNDSVLRLEGTSLPDEFFTTDMLSAFARFAAGAGCDAAPVDTVLGGGGGTMIRHHFGGCDGAVPMTFVEVVGGGHTWPGAEGVPPSALDATLDGWAFLSAFTLPP